MHTQNLLSLQLLNKYIQRQEHTNYMQAEKKSCDLQTDIKAEAEYHICLHLILYSQMHSCCLADMGRNVIIAATCV